MHSNQTVHNLLIQDFYESHNSWLCSWLSKKLGSTLDAADLTHDTFIRLLLKSDAEHIVEPRAYLINIAHGLMVSHIRRRDLERAYLDALMHFSSAETPSPETQAIVLETLIRLDAMLDGLPAHIRNAYLLLQLEGLSYAEIAKKLGVSVRTVGNYIAKASLHCMLMKQS